MSTCYDVFVEPGRAFEILLILFVVAGVIYTIFSIVCVYRFFPSEPRMPWKMSGPPVSVLKPLKGKDPELEENIRSFCLQDYPEYEVLLGFTDHTDEALPVARNIVSSEEGCRARIVTSQIQLGPNHKVSNLEGLRLAARNSMLVISDSDMRVDKYYLGRIMEEYMSHENVGLVTSLYKITRPASLGAALESLSLAMDFMPSVLVARRLEGITFGLGASMLVSKKALDEIGGLSDVAGFIADDYQIGNRIWRKGYSVVLSDYVIEDIAGRMSVADHLLHQLRWARTYRASRPKGYMGYGITHAFPLSLALIALYGMSQFFLVLSGGVIVLRYVLAFVIYKKVIEDKKWLRWLVLLPLRDILSFFVWALSFLGSRVCWRGQNYRILKGGKIVLEKS